MLCPKCGSNLPEQTGNLCPHCGNQVIPAAEVKTPPQPQPILTQTPSPITAQPLPNQPLQNQKKGKSKLPLILIGLLLLLLLVGVGLFANGSFDTINPFKSEIEEPINQPTSSAQENPIQEPTTSATQETTPSAYTKYFTDADQDKIADFVETAIGTDPAKNDCLAQAGCGESQVDPFKTEVKNVLFILDSSGSMAQTLSTGETKMEAAKTALKNHIAGIDPDYNVGLEVYGHQGSNNTTDKPVSCAGIETLYPLGAIDKDKFNQSVDSFSPTGWTPIAGSFLYAKDNIFKGKEYDKNFLVLVSDGEETCDGDPVAAAKQLKDAGVTAEIDVIGLAVDENTKKQLEAIAAAGGGKYYSASDPVELSNALAEIDTERNNIIANMGCVFTNQIAYVSCIQNIQLKFINWAHQYFFDLYKKDKAEAIFFRDEYRPVVNKYLNELVRISNKETNEQIQKLEEEMKKLQEKSKQAIN